jgi:hypothetical protein
VTVTPQRPGWPCGDRPWHSGLSHRDFLSGHFKTGQPWSGQNRPIEGARDVGVVPCLAHFGQV